MEADASTEALSAEGLVDEAIASSVVTGLGYATCSRAPWCEKTHVGRITFWPAGEPSWRQNMAARCYMHPSCSVSRKRDMYDQNAILKWLYSEQPLPPDATAAEKRAAKERHMGPKAAEFLPKAAKGPAKASSASSSV